MRRGLTLAWLLVVLGCGDGGESQSGCDPVQEACTVSHVFPARTIGAGEEEETQCQSWTMHNPTELWVSAVDFSADGAWHHSNWFYVPDTEYALPDGFWDCGDNDFDELIAALLGGFLFAQSTQSTSETQQFPPGAAIRIPPYSRVIASTHLLNFGEAPITTASTITIRSIPEAEVTVKLTPFRLTYHDLHLPAGSVSNFSTSCDVASEYQRRIGEPMKFELYYVLSHYHTLGTAFRLGVTGGAMDGTRIYERIGEAAGDSLGHAFDPPIDLADFTGLTYGCEYENPNGVEVGWGIGDQEMCVMAGFADTNMAFDANVEDGTGAAVGTEGDVVQNTGPCSLIGFPWFHDKAGGVGP
jgi:hypothetical protein